MRRLLGLLALAVAGVFQSSCVVGDWGDTGRYREDFHYSWPLDPGAQVSVETRNGSVEISSWDKNTIDIAGTKYASDESLLHDVRIDISHTPSSVRIHTIAPEFFHGGAGAEYTIHVPRRVMLDQIRSSNGALRVDAVEGNANMRTSNGGVHLSDVHGDADIETSNGSIDIENQEGSLRLHTTNAHIKAESHGGRFEAETSNGSIEGRLTDLNTSWPLRAESTNGHIDLDVEGRLPDMRLSSSNSSIDLRLPDSASARLVADTSHSDITSDFDLTTRGGTVSKDHLEGQIGGGGPTIEINTSNGAIHVRKR